MIVCLALAWWGNAVAHAQELPQSPQPLTAEAAARAIDVTVESSPENRPQADRIRAEIEGFLADVFRKLRATRTAPITIVLAPSTAALRADIEDRFGHGVRLPSAVAGLAFSQRGVLYLNLEVLRESGGLGAVTGSAGDAVLATLKHELCHLVLGQFQTKASWPSWFEEGLAQWVERSAQVPSNEVLAVRAGTRELPSLDQISDAIDGRVNVSLGYAMAEAAVRTLFHLKSPDQLGPFYERFVATGDFDDAFAGGFGMSIEQFEERYRWRAQPGGFDAIITFLGMNWWVLLFGGAFLIALIGVWRKRKRNRAMMSQWEAEDGG